MNIGIVELGSGKNGYCKSLYYSSIGYNVSSYNTLYGTEYYADNIPTDFGKSDDFKEPLPEERIDIFEELRACRKRDSDLTKIFR